MSKRYRQFDDYENDNMAANVNSHINSAIRSSNLHNPNPNIAVEAHKNIVNVRKTPQSIVTEYTLDSSHLVADSYHAGKDYSQNDLRTLNTSANMTLPLASPIYIDKDNYSWDVAVGQSSSIPNANYNITAVLGNNTITYSFSQFSTTGDTAGVTFTFTDGHKSVLDIYNEFKEHLLATGRYRGTSTAPEYPIQFITDQTTGKAIIKCAQEATAGTQFNMAITISAGLNGYAIGIMGVLGFVGATGSTATDPIGDITPINIAATAIDEEYDLYTPIKEININYGVTSYHINCNIAKGTVDSRGSVSTIKTFIWNVAFGSRMDFTNTGDQRFCAIDPSLDRITEIKVWVTGKTRFQFIYFILTFIYQII